TDQAANLVLSAVPSSSAISDHAKPGKGSGCLSLVPQPRSTAISQFSTGALGSTLNRPLTALTHARVQSDPRTAPPEGLPLVMLSSLAVWRPGTARHRTMTP